MYKMAESNEGKPHKICSLCLDTSDLKKAVKMCIDCKVYLCDECVKHHSKFPLFKQHKVLDDLEEEVVKGNEEGTAQDDVDSKDENGALDYCINHQGQVIDSYCKDHDNICCMVCVTIIHRSCENVLTLDQASRGVNAKNELDETKRLLDTYIAKIKFEQLKRSDNIAQLDEQKLAILNDIDRFQENIVKKIATMAEASRRELRSKHEELVNAVKKDVERLENVTSVTEESVKTLSIGKGQRETKVFTNIKRSEKVAKDAEILINDLPTKWPIRKLDYCIDYDSPHNDTTIKTFGHFIENENKPSNIPRLSERFNGVFSVKLESDERNCIVSGICILENGMYCISDCANRKLKRFNRNYELHDSLELDGAPTSACVSGSKQVVVALCNEKLIVFVSCSDTLSVASSFSTEHNCYGVFFDSKNNELFVCCGSSLCVYSKNGNLLKIIEDDESGEPFFDDPKNCVVMPGSETICTADCRNGLIILNKDGKRIWDFTDSKLEKPWGVCSISCQQLLVAGSSSRNILQVSKDGNLISEFLKEEKETGMSKLYTLAYDKKHSTVMLGGICNKICTYLLCR